MCEKKEFLVKGSQELVNNLVKGNTKLIDANAFWGRVVQSRKETIIDDTITISMSEFVKLLDDMPPSVELVGI